MERSPDDGRVWSALATAWMMQGDVERAQIAFLRAAELLPAHIGTWLALAWCQILRQDLAAARHSLNTALELDRNFGETHGALAVVAALQGQEEEARQAIERAKRLDRSGLSARYAEAVLSGQARDPVAVQALARRLLQGRPGVDGAALLERTLQGLKRRP
jgi:Tfp pilus assembly protein PilF